MDLLFLCLLNLSLLLECTLNKGLQILTELGCRWQVRIHHVTGFVVGHLDSICS